MDTVENIIRDLLVHIEANPKREGLAETPLRYRKFLEEFLKPEPFNITVFDNDGYDEMVVQSNIPFFSLCEHHLLPFFGQGTVAYIPDEKIVGLSKLTRILDHFSRRLQNQERITTDVASLISTELSPKGVGVALNARHLCMEMRGVQKPGTETTTSCVKGLIKTNPATRSEFLRFVS